MHLKCRSKVSKCETNAKGSPQPSGKFCTVLRVNWSSGQGPKQLLDKQIETPCGAVIEVDLQLKNIKNGVSKKVTLKSAELISIG